MAELWFIAVGGDPADSLTERYKVEHPGEDIPPHIAQMLAQLDRKTAEAEARTGPDAEGLACEHVGAERCS